MYVRTYGVRDRMPLSLPMGRSLSLSAADSWKERNAHRLACQVLEQIAYQADRFAGQEREGSAKYVLLNRDSSKRSGKFLNNPFSLSRKRLHFCPQKIKAHVNAKKWTKKQQKLIICSYLSIRLTSFFYLAVKLFSFHPADPWGIT